MKKLILAVVAVTMMGAMMLLTAVASTPVFANSCGGANTAIIDCPDSDDGGGIYRVLNLIIDILSVGVGVLGVIGISISGIQYLTAGGNEEKTRKAKRRLFEIIIGIAVFVVMFALLKWLLPNFSEANLEK